MKQFAFYYDGVPYDAGFHPDQFTRADVVRIFTMCHQAVRKIEDDQIVKMAKGLFLAKSEILTDPAQGLLKMIRTAITADAFAAIKATLPLGTVAFDAKTSVKGELGT